MPLQNRVDPFGELHAVEARGTLMGNRGILHGDDRRIRGRRWTTRAWIACRVAFPARRRTLMQPGAYTELFFLDEVTALAAGHRPCFECRRADARTFAHHCGALAAPVIDDMLHEERFLATGMPAVRGIYAAILPVGAAVTTGGAVFVRHESGWLRWSFEGYAPARLPDERCDLLTPSLTVRALSNGYRPEWHPSSEREGAHQ